jgi:transcriptional regulator with XRE-family HTH domain
MQHKSEKTILLIEKFGLKIKEKREIKYKSRRLFANEYELDSGNLARIENGQINPKLTMLWRISEALNIPLSELFMELEKELGKNFHITDI